MNWVSRTVLTVSLVALPVYLYVGLRLIASFARVRPSGIRTARRILGCLILWFCLFPVLVVVENSLGLTRNRFDLVNAGPVVHAVLVYPYWVALIAVVELLVPLLVLDIASLAARLRIPRPENYLHWLAIARLTLGATGVLFVSARVFFDTSHVRDSVVNIRIRDLPAHLRDFRITLVADLQVDQYTSEGKIDQMHHVVESHRPQLLLCAGDMVTWGLDYVDESTKAMCAMSGSVASISVMGDHDYWSAPEAIAKGLRQCGWIFLENEHDVVDYKGTRILVTGLTHVYSQRLNASRLDSILAQAPTADFKILLVHQPAKWLIEAAARRGYNLVLAGHTHGGQIVVHPLGVAFTPSMLETPYYSGEYRLGTLNVVVTNGIGLTLAPVRYGAPAEVTTIVLEKDGG